MRDKLKNKRTDDLFNAILELKSVDECYDFFEDLCTAAEIQDMTQRFEVACMLNENKAYSEITVKTGASTATISRVKRSLHYGSDGYKMILDRIKNK